MATLNIGGLHLYYLDTSAWSYIRTHPDRDEVVKHITRPGKRCAEVSFINACELLRTPDATTRAELCGVMASAMTEGLVILPHPTVVLEHAAVAFRAGIHDSITLPEDPETRGLRLLVEDPSRLDAEGLEWLNEQERRETEGRLETWRLVESMLQRGAVLGYDLLDRPELAAVMANYDVAKKLELTPAEIGRLLRENLVWAAFALSLGLSFEMFNLNPYSETSKTKARKLPDNFDMMQLTYLALANDFVSNDDGLLDVAGKAADFLRLQRRAMVQVRTAKEFFLRASYPHPQLEKRP